MIKNLYLNLNWKSSVKIVEIFGQSGWVFEGVFEVLFQAGKCVDGRLSEG